MDETFAKMSNEKNKNELKEEEYELRGRFNIQVLVVVFFQAIVRFLLYLGWIKLFNIT